MIVAQLIGGLGNQLFQYAAARSLALHHGTDLRLDISSYGWTSSRRFELANFGITTCDIRNPWLSKTIDRFSRTPVYQEPHFHYDEKFFDAPRDCRLSGFWQSENYFAHHQETIRQELRIVSTRISHLHDLASKIRQQCSVSIHVRRGDYLVGTGFEVLPMEYYRQAIALLETKFSNLMFYVFSDDPTWVASNFLIKDWKFCTISGTIAKSNIEDLYLMSQCRHHIIANSSFSWWGAWLNSNVEKMVIAPKAWFGSLPHRTHDLIPKSWQRI